MSFQHDVFLCYSHIDVERVTPIAERLRRDGIRVWFSEWKVWAGDSVARKWEEGLESSRVLVLCLSRHMAGGNWPTYEKSTFRFRDPANKDRRLIPVRLDDTELPQALGRYAYIDWWNAANREAEYLRLLQVSRTPSLAEHADSLPPVGGWSLKFQTLSGAMTDGFKRLYVGGNSSLRTAKLGEGIGRPFAAVPSPTYCLALNRSGTLLFGGGADGLIRLWDTSTRKLLHEFKGHSGPVRSLSLSDTEASFCSASDDGTVRVWGTKTRETLRILEHGHAVNCAKADGVVVTGADDGVIRMWDMNTGDNMRRLRGHTGAIWGLDIRVSDERLVTGSADNTVRVWDLATERCLSVLEGHTAPVRCVALSRDGKYVASGALDRTIHLWEAETGRRLLVADEHRAGVYELFWSPVAHTLCSVDCLGEVRVWRLEEFLTRRKGEPFGAPSDVLYTNAKVLLVGESGVGKTGLSKRLASGQWQASDGSTLGAWATQVKVPVAASNGIEREVWLWDFGGQADQRLVHQLYMDDTALAVLVFDGQKTDLFETLVQWDRDLSRASQNENFAKLLVAGRVDAGGLRASRTEVERFRSERGYQRVIETSAKTGANCDVLKDAIISGINWERIPWRSSPALFKRLKEEIVRMKDDGRILMRFNELREALQLRLSGEGVQFTDEELKAVLCLLSGPGVVWELKFGSWVLFRPELINTYGQRVIQTMRDDPLERGCIAEDRVLQGNLKSGEGGASVPVDDERFVLLAMHKILVERGLCLREHTEEGALLIFPSFYRRERPELAGHPAAFASYRFAGFLDEIYATLVVRLHYTKPFAQDRLWRYAADFKTGAGRQLGFKLERLPDGRGEIVLYCDLAISLGEKIIFSRYVHEHLAKKAKDVERLRHYVCPDCGTPVAHRDIAMKRLDAWLQRRPAGKSDNWWRKAGKALKNPPTILCVNCENRVPLWDEMEQSFASSEIKERVRQLQAQSDFALDSESKERALVGDVISTVALAGQKCEEYSEKRFGLDMEVEFKDDRGVPTGRKLYLQLKSGGSHLRKRKTDGVQVFTIRHPDHATYWMNQAFPVMLVIGDEHGDISWMEIKSYLLRVSENGKKRVTQIEYVGEKFDALSVRAWRERELSKTLHIPAG